MTRGVAFLLRAAAVAAAVGLLWLAAAPDAGAQSRKRSKAPAKKTPDSLQVLVRIGKETITRADVQRRIESLPEQFRANYATPEGRQQLLERMVEERVWLAQAVKTGVPERPQVRQQIEQQRRDLLIRTYLNELMATSSAPSDSEARAYYEAHRDEYKQPATASIRHVQAKSEKDAKKVRQSALQKKDWNELVRKFSTDTLTRTTGGSLGTVTRDGVFPALGPQPAMAETAFALGEGGIGGPFKTDKGWHVIKVDAIKPETVRPYEQVRQVILRQLGSQRSQDFYKDQLDGARKNLGVKPDSAAIKSFVTQKKTAREMFNEAQTLGPADARVEAYRKLLAEYPDSDVSPQAQFMIGFIYSEELKNYDQAEMAFRTLLQRYPKAELAASARWMLDHMRSEEAPAFIDLDADSTAAAKKP